MLPLPRLLNQRCPTTPIPCTSFTILILAPGRLPPTLSSYSLPKQLMNLFVFVNIYVRFPIWRKYLYWLCPIQHRRTVHPKYSTAVVTTLYICQLLTASWRRESVRFCGAD